ncbi:helix-hairpin-helix domain-containing protein [Oceanithermus sp.]
MALLYILIGVLVGWLIEWIIDWLYWRGQVFDLRTELEDCRRSLLEEQERAKQFQLKISKLEEENVKLHAQVRDLEARLDKLSDERNAALQELQALKQQPATEPDASTTAAAPAEPTKYDDLKKIEGIGPKIEKLLNQAGIRSFTELARTSSEKLREILRAAGSRFRLADPTTWPRQAKLAAEERWDELQEYQDALNGGREG